MLKLAGAIGAAAITAAVSFVTPPVASATMINQETMAQFIATVNLESDRYGTGPVRVYVDDIGGEDTLAETSGGSIILNTIYAVLTPEQFNAALADDFALGYHPSGCAGIQAVAIHEMGHVVDRSRGLIARYAVTRAVNAGRITDDLHGYAFEDGVINPGEAVAVSFQAVECGSATPTEQMIYNMLIN